MSAAATASSLNRFLISRLFIKVGELVSTQQHFLALGNCGMTRLVALVYGSLHFSGFHGSIETTVFFYSEEEVPSLLGNRDGQVLDIVRTCSRVYNLIEVRFFFQQQLLVTRHTLREFVRSIISLVERSNRH